MSIRYKDASLDNVPQIIIEAIKKAISLDKGLFIYGGTGTGKTYIAHALAYSVKKERGWSVDVSNFVGLLGEFREFIVRGTYQENLCNFCKENCIILDDLGAEKLTDFVQEFLYSIINNRYENMKRTVFTTNLDLKAFEARYGDRLLSRIGEMCIMVELKGEDKRVK